MCRLNLLVVLIVFAGLAYAQSNDDIKIKIDPVEPFRIAGNIYYVGSTDVTSYLIVTRKGNILIDSGMKEMVPTVKTSVERLGFKFADIKIILNSHAHFDHAGGIAEIRRLTGARFLASKLDAPSLERGGIGDPNFGDKYPFEPTVPDQTFEDGKKVRLGGTTLRANITPGHTKGCTTWTTTVHDAGQDLRVIFVCSVSSPGYRLVDNKEYPTIESDYRKTFAWFDKQRVDIFLGSHAGFFDLQGKMIMLKNGSGRNPFIDPSGYKQFIADSEKAFEEKLKTLNTGAK